MMSLDHNDVDGSPLSRVSSAMSSLGTVTPVGTHVRVTSHLGDLNATYNDAKDDAGSEYPVYVVGHRFDVLDTADIWVPGRVENVRMSSTLRPPDLLPIQQVNY
jgi:hypothetical protein